MSTPLTDATLAEFAEGHRKADNPNVVASRDGQRVDYCYGCEQDWPCLTIRVRDEVVRLRADTAALRSLLWLNHGHSGPALYGDDGKMLCKACRPFGGVPWLDFQHDSIGRIVDAFSRAALLAAARLASEVETTTQEENKQPG